MTFIDIESGLPTTRVEYTCLIFSLMSHPNYGGDASCRKPLMEKHGLLVVESYIYAGRTKQQ